MSTLCPATWRTRIVHDPNNVTADFVRRITFDPDIQIMHGEKRIQKTDLKWFFLVNLNGCQILPAAWVQYAMRGKRLNKAASLGSTRYAAGSETEEDIRMRAESADFRTNIRNSREEALALIEEIRAELTGGYL